MVIGRGSSGRGPTLVRRRPHGCGTRARNRGPKGPGAGSSVGPSAMLRSDSAGVRTEGAAMDADPGAGVRRTTVRDVMSTGVLSVGPDAPFLEITTTLFAGRGTGGPGPGPDGRLLAVISEADLLVTAERLDPIPDHPWRHRRRHTGRPGPEGEGGGSIARGLMGSPAVTVAPTATVAAAARVMREQRLSWLPVTDIDGRVLGVLGCSDLLAVFLRDGA